ncbi:MAG TPA: GNAT family N-acetyltransferase [Stellaceae bacterium]
MNETPAVTTAVEPLEAFSRTDLEDLCDAAEAAIKGGGGFGWLQAPPRHIMENYWRGVLLVPERRLFVARLDGTICGSAQLVRPPRNNEAQSFAAQVISNFIAPWARGHGLARQLVVAVEDAARAAGFAVLNLDVRDTQGAAIQLYESLGYERWGTHPCYARVEGEVVPGHFYYKRLAVEAGAAR